MLFDGLIRCRLEALLRPWLRDDRNLELSLGFFRSTGELKNVTLNSSALNELLDDPFRFCFKEVTIEHLSLQFSPFSSSAFTLVVRGLRVVLSLGEEEDEFGVKWRCKWRDKTVEERKKFLREIDPEGCILHDSIQNISQITVKTWRTSLLNAVIKHGCLQLYDVRVILKSPRFQDPFSCSLNVKRFGATSQIKSECFIMGLMGSFFVAFPKSSLLVDVDCFQIALNREKGTDCVVNVASMVNLLNLNYLQFTAFCTDIPSIKVVLSPLDLSALLMFYEFFSLERKHARSGKLLWSIVSARISSLIPGSKQSLVRTIQTACMWLRYIKTYESLLLGVGYPTQDALKKSVLLMSQDRAYSRHVSSQWDLISDLEKYLPLEAIAVARRIIRARTASIEPRNDGKIPLPLVACPVLKFFHLLFLIFRLIKSLFISCMKVFFLHKGVSTSPMSTPDASSVPENGLLQRSFSLNVREIMLSVSPDNAVRSSFNRNSFSQWKKSQKSLTSFHFYIDEFFMWYHVSFLEYHLKFASGQLNVVSSSSREGIGSSSSTQDVNQHSTKSQIVVQSESAGHVCSGEAPSAHAFRNTIVTSISGLDNLLEKLWCNWDGHRLKSEAAMFTYAPWILCEMGIHEADVGGIGHSTCFNGSLVIGKLNFSLECDSLVSIFVIFTQVQCSPYWNRKGNIIEYGPGAVISDSSLGSDSETYPRKLQMGIVRMIPDKNIHFGALIAGPHIVISLSNSHFTDEANNLQNMCVLSSFDISNLEFLVSPNFEETVGLSDEDFRSYDIEPEGFVVEDPRGDFPESDNGTYTCQGTSLHSVFLIFNGFNAYYSQNSWSHKDEIIIVQPAKSRIRVIRKFHHSLGSSVVFVSAVAHLDASDIFILIFLDDLSQLMKMIFEGFHELLGFCINGLGDDFRMETANPDSEFARTLYVQSNENEAMTTAKVVLKCNFVIKTFHFFLQNSRKGLGVKTSINVKPGSFATDVILENDVNCSGIHFSTQSSVMQFMYQEGKLYIVAGTHGVQCGLSRCLPEVGVNSDGFELRNALYSLSPLTEASVHYCKLSLSLKLPSRGSLDESRHHDTMPSHRVSFPVNVDQGGPWDHLCMLNLAVSGVCVAACHLKDTPVHEPEEFKAVVFVGNKYEELSCECKGGFIILEASSLMMLIGCFSLYYQRILELASLPFQVITTQHSRNTAPPHGYPCANPQQSQYQKLLRSVKLLSLRLLGPDIILVERHESGRLQELQLNVNIDCHLELVDIVHKFSFTLSKLSVLSQSVDEKSEFNHSNTQRQQIVRKRSQNYVVKNVQCSISVEGHVGDMIDPGLVNRIWAGKGSVSEFDIAVSLDEIKMILSGYDALSKVLNGEEAFKVDSNERSYSQAPEGNMAETIPDGAIVAIQDVDQHMYVAVEGVDSRYKVAGAIHYSLMAAQALFRIKYQKARIWRPETQYFSLISLYAKDKYGESLRLNCDSGSRFVGISCSNDNSSALWRMLPYKSEAYGNSIGMEHSASLSRKFFHLVNKKNNFAVAFNNSILEFASKPGNVFKWKVFQDSVSLGNIPMKNLPLNLSPKPEATKPQIPDSGTSHQGYSNTSENREITTNKKHLGVSVVVDKITLTIVHKLGSEEKVPLLQGSTMPNQIIIQVSNLKVRIMNILEVNLRYFNGHQNSWKDFIQPLEICSFYSQKFISHGAEISNGVPRHFYARTGEVCILLTELSLDIILFIIGKLELAGPYAVKSSAVLGNCCKVENKSGLTLVCQFYDNQEVVVHRRELSIVSWRHLPLANHPLEASSFSAQLVKQGFSTYPIRISLLEDRLFSWRTRITAEQDAKSYPGPFIVFEISRGVEDGTCIRISPLLTIHNDTDFLLELCFQRPKHEETESALLVLKAGDVIDDTMLAFNAIDLPGGLRKILTSLSVGNYLFSFRPEIGELVRNSEISSEWSDDLKGGKPVRLSGLFDKLTYQMRKALSIDSLRSSLQTINCALIYDKHVVKNLYFLIQTVGKSIPVVNPDSAGFSHPSRNPVAVQEQKELFILPTIQVSNLLETEVRVSLTDADPPGGMEYNNIGNQATIKSGSTVNFYADPDIICFTVTLSSFDLSSIPTSSSEWLKKLQKKRGDIPHLDVELNFGDGKYLAVLRLSRGQRGTLKAYIFTSYALRNDTDAPLICVSPKQKPLTRVDIERFDTNIPLERGLYLPPKATMSWFLKSHKLQFMLLGENTMEAKLDFDLLSGVTQIDLETEEVYGSKNTMRLGVSVRPLLAENIPSQIVSLSPRYILFNESETVIAIQQFYVQDTENLITISSKNRIALRLKKVMRNVKTTNVIDHMLRKHTKLQDDLSFFLQFRPIGTGLGWSGPVCVASLGRFFVRFRKSSGFSDGQFGAISGKEVYSEHAFLHVREEGTTITLHFHWPPLTDIPYRIENYLHNAPITYYQKGSYEPDVLGAGASVNYVWDDLTLQHKLVIKSDDLGLLHEINLDKVRSWKPFQSRSFLFYSQLDKSSEDQNRNTRSRIMASDTSKLGYEVYADGLTRVLRICEFSESVKLQMLVGRRRKLHLRISYFSIHLLEVAAQVDLSEHSEYAPLIGVKLQGINWNAETISRYKYIQLGVQSLSIDEKWPGAPFSAMLRQHRSEKTDVDNYVIRVALISLLSSNVRQVKSLSFILQPLDLNLDEETLMKIVPFWRRSLSDSKTPYQQYYFDHLEISPIKIVASFLPGDSCYRYSSSQETLRSFLHTVIKVPEIKRKTVELNGVLVTHALITLPELALKCAQHYSWYMMRAVYMAKGSPLLPPDFVSIFDDLASSSLDIFFDPSRGFLNLPSVTLGTLKLISKFIDKNGFSGTKRYFGDLGNTLKTAGSNVLFAAVTEVSDSVLKGAEASGFSGMLTGFHQGMLKLAMEPHVLSSAIVQGGPDQRIKLERSPGVDELYIEGYLQAMLDTYYKQEYLRVRVLDDQVILKNLPPSTVLIEEIMANVKGFLASKSLLKGESSMRLRYIQGERIEQLRHAINSYMIKFHNLQLLHVAGLENWTHIAHSVRAPVRQLHHPSSSETIQQSDQSI